MNATPPVRQRRLRGSAITAWCALLLLVIPLLAVPARAGLADQVGATFGLMLQDVISAFPPIEGLVVAVDGDRVYIDLTARDGIQPGQEFTVFRKGEVFRHPQSKRPLGRYEEILGYAQVQRVLPGYSEAELVPADGKPPPRPEDGVRITRGRIKVAVAPPLDLTRARADLRRVPFMIALALDRSKRFQAVDPTVIQDLLAAQGTRMEELLARPEKAVALGRTAEVTGWVVPVVIERRGVTYLDVTWVSAVTGMALFSKRMELTRADSVAEQRFPWEPLPED